MKIHKQVKNIHHYNSKINIIRLLTALLLFTSSLSKNYIHIIHSQSSNISIKVNATGVIYYYHLEGHHFHCNELYTRPNKVYLNGKDKGSPTYSMYINDTNDIIKLSWITTITSAACLFGGCINIREIDLTEFDTSGLTRMNNMFSGCSGLTSIIMSNLDTSKVDIMEYMFHSCRSLTSLDLSSFDTRKVTSMDRLFEGCTSLTFLNLSSFQTPAVQKLNSLFKDCKSLTSIYFPLLETSNFVQLDKVFYGCTSLKSLDLSNFTYFQRCRFSNNIFENCQSLQFINFGNIQMKCEYYNDAFEKTPENLIICSGDTKWNTIMNNNGGGNISISCNNNGDLNDKTCYSKNTTSLFNKGMCNKCGNNFYYSYNGSSSNNDSKINCQKIPKGYYLDVNETYPLPKQCYLSCETCEKGGNANYHNCIECKSDYKRFEKYDGDYKNCYNDVITPEIKTEFISKTNDIKEHIKFDSDGLIFQYNKTYIDNGNDVEMKKGQVLCIYTNSQNQKQNDNDKTVIDLLQCEERLKQVNHIPPNSSLYLIKYEIAIEGMKIPKLEYEVYYPLYNETFIKLDLSECKGMNIEVSYPIKLNDTLDKYNASSGYYNDLCYKTTSNFGTDISLNDRRDQFIDDNMTLCEEDCSLIDYNYTTEKAKCSCLVKITLPFFDEIKFDKDKLYKSFMDVKNVANLNLMKCYKDVFKGKNLLKNYGFYIFIGLFVIYFFCLILFYSKFYFLLLNKITDIEKAKNYLFQSKKKKKNKKLKTKDTISNISSNKDIISNKGDNKSENAKSEISTRRKRKNRKIKLENMFPPKKSKSKGKKNIRTLLDNDNNNGVNELPIKKAKTKAKNIKFNLPDSKKEKEKEKEDNIISKKYREILEHNDSEINSVSYNKAIQVDKRSFIQYYLSLLRMNHLLVFSFYSNEKDYNSQIIKIFLFFFFFSVHFTINALFFSDETMHTIYLDEGHFNFIYQISQIIYSSLISAVISILVKYLSLSEKSIIEMKNEEKMEELELIVKKLVKSLQIKFMLFFIVAFVLLGFFLFYNSCFCGIYVNTQIHLIKDSVISFTLSLVYPFGISLLPGIFRITALKAKKKDKECMYKFSQLIQSL